MPMTPATPMTMPFHCSRMRDSGIIVPMCTMVAGTMMLAMAPKPEFLTIPGGITPTHRSTRKSRIAVSIDGIHARESVETRSATAMMSNSATVAAMEVANTGAPLSWAGNKRLELQDAVLVDGADHGFEVGELLDVGQTRAQHHGIPHRAVGETAVALRADERACVGGGRTQRLGE